MTEYKALVVKGNFISTCEYDYMVFAQFDWFAKFMRQNALYTIVHSSNISLLI